MISIVAQPLLFITKYPPKYTPLISKALESRLLGFLPLTSSFVLFIGLFGVLAWLYIRKNSIYERIQKKFPGLQFCSLQDFICLTNESWFKPMRDVDKLIIYQLAQTNHDFKKKSKEISFKRQIGLLQIDYISLGCNDLIEEILKDAYSSSNKDLNDWIYSELELKESYILHSLSHLDQPLYKQLLKIKSDQGSIFKNDDLSQSSKKLLNAYIR